jgi:scyllo-inositol 2-dehydrogenase (NADP+)
MNMVRVGLLGFGMSAQVFHTPTIRSVAGMELACILERSGSLARQKYPEARVAGTLDELLADDSIRLCVITTPNATHYDLARRCLDAGRNVAVDKPFTVTLQEAQELTEMARQKKRLLTVYQNRRWDGDFQTIRTLVASGELGRIVEYEARFDRFRPEPKPGSWRERPEPGSGVAIDLGPHLIDQALLLFGTPAAVTATIFTQRAWAKADDAFDIFLEYPGLRALLRGRMLAYVPGPHFLLHGTQGSFVKYGVDPQEEQLKSGVTPGDRGWGEERPELWGTLTLAGGAAPRKLKTQAGDYRKFYENMRDAIEHGNEIEVRPEQALETMRVVELARQSSQEKRTVNW